MFGQTHARIGMGIFNQLIAKQFNSASVIYFHNYIYPSIYEMIVNIHPNRIYSRKLNIIQISISRRVPVAL